MDYQNKVLVILLMTASRHVVIKIVSSLSKVDYQNKVLEDSNY